MAAETLLQILVPSRAKNRGEVAVRGCEGKPVKVRRWSATVGDFDSESGYLTAICPTRRDTGLVVRATKDTVRAPTNKGCQMSTRPLRRVLLAASAASALALSATAPLSAASPTPAQRAASWLVTQAPNGTFGSPSAISVAQTTSFAFAVGTNATARRTALKGMRTLWVKAPALVTSVSDDPGALALWIMAAHAYGVNPRHFSSVNLVSKLLATLQGPTTSNPGLFGSADPTYDGTYRQGLSLVALKAAGATIPTSAVRWLTKQRCPGGGFSSEVSANPCNGLASNYQGPDLNSTALGIAGLKAAGIAPTASSVAFVKANQHRDGGFGFFPGDPSDPSSTGLMLAALHSVGSATFASPLTKGASSMKTFQLSSGGFAYPGSNAADVLSSIQGLIGLEGKALWAVLSAGSASSITHEHGRANASQRRCYSAEPVVT